MYMILRRLSLLFYLLLITTLFLLAFYSGPEGLGAKLVLGVLFNSGLLLIAYSMFKGTKRSYIWLCFILLFYFIAFVQAAFAPSAHLIQLMQYFALGLSVMLFVVAMYASRYFVDLGTQP